MIHLCLHHPDDIFITLTCCVLHKERCCHPRQQDSLPLPMTPPGTPCAYVCIGGVCIVLAPLHTPTKKTTFFHIVTRAQYPSRVCQYPTVTATSRRGSRACFDGDIGHVIIDASLVRHRVAMCGRGCRRQRIDIQQNKLMRSRNALASTDPPNEPITPAIVCGHLLIDGQHPKQAHCS